MTGMWIMLLSLVVNTVATSESSLQSFDFQKREPELEDKLELALERGTDVGGFTKRNFEMDIFLGRNTTGMNTLTPRPSLAEEGKGHSFTSDFMQFLEHSDDFRSRNISTTISHSRTARQIIDIPDDAIFALYFKLVTPYGTSGWASWKGDYRVEVTFNLPNEIRRRRKRSSISSERNDVYEMFSNFLSKAGLDGKTCVLRAVCEVGENPMDEFGLFGEFINLIFTPGFRSEEEHFDHVQAEEYGRSFGNCWSAFPDCPMSMREMIYEFFLGNLNQEDVLDTLDF